MVTEKSYIPPKANFFFYLSLQGYFRKVAMQHSRPIRRGPLPSVGASHCKLTKEQQSFHLILFLSKLEYEY